MAGGRHLVWTDVGTDVGNAANVQHTSENASRKINRVSAINKEGKSDPLQCQESSQRVSGQQSKGIPTRAPAPMQTPKARYLQILGEAVIRGHFNYPHADWIKASGDKI